MHTLLQKNLDSAHRAIHDGKGRIASVSHKESPDPIASCRLSLLACLPGQKPSPPIEQSLMKTRAASMAPVAIPSSGMGHRCHHVLHPQRMAVAETPIDLLPCRHLATRTTCPSRRARLSLPPAAVHTAPAPPSSGGPRAIMALPARLEPR